MPRVSQRHLDARRQHILAAARRCFVRNGFHATSMQDILREADVSTGALYRYFTSKEAIITAIVHDVLAEVASAFEARLADDAPLPPLDEIFFQLYSTIERLDRTKHICHLAVQIWGEAQRTPALVVVVREAYAVPTTFLTRIVARYQTEGRLSSTVPPDHLARVLLSLAAGFIVQRSLFGDTVDAVTYRTGLQLLLAPTALSAAAAS